MLDHRFATDASLDWAGTKLLRTGDLGLVGSEGSRADTDVLSSLRSVESWLVLPHECSEPGPQLLGEAVLWVLMDISWTPPIITLYRCRLRYAGI